MRYIPRACDGRAQGIMWLMIAAGALCCVISPLFAAAQAVFQFGAVALIGGGIYVGVRYVMTEFTYEIVMRDGAVPSGGVTEVPAPMLDFTVRKKNSRRGAVMDACMNLGELRYFAILPREGGREREPYRKFPALRVFDYTPSIVPKAQYIAVFVDSAQNAVGLVIEPDGDFIAVLSRCAAENGDL